jgi:hypothetical protein
LLDEMESGSDPHPLDRPRYATQRVGLRAAGESVAEAGRCKLNPVDA